MATKKSAGTRPPRPVAKTKAGGKPKQDSFAELQKQYLQAQKSRNAARNDMRPWNGPASSSGATRYVREMDNLNRLSSEFSLASKKKKTAAKKPLKTGPSAPRRGARYLTQAESKAASKGSGYKTKDIKCSDERKTRPGRQGMYSCDIDAKGRDIMVYGGPTGFGETAYKAPKKVKSSRSSSAMGGKYPPKKKASPRGKKY